MAYLSCRDHNIAVGGGEAANHPVGCLLPSMSMLVLMPGMAMVKMVMKAMMVGAMAKVMPLL